METVINWATSHSIKKFFELMDIAISIASIIIRKKEGSPELRESLKTLKTMYEDIRILNEKSIKP